MFHGKINKLVINAVKLNVNSKTVTDKLWKDLKLDDNEILDNNPNISKILYIMLHEHQEVFSNKECHVGKTSWDTFKMELVPGSRPVRQQIRTLAPSSKKICKEPNKRPNLTTNIKISVIVYVG